MDEIKELLWKYKVEHHLPPMIEDKDVVEGLIKDSSKLILVEKKLGSLLDTELFENNRELYFIIKAIWDLC